MIGLSYSHGNTVVPNVLSKLFCESFWLYIKSCLQERKINRIWPKLNDFSGVAVRVLWLSWPLGAESTGILENFISEQILEVANKGSSSINKNINTVFWAKCDSAHM